MTYRKSKQLLFSVSLILYFMLIPLLVHSQTASRNDVVKTLYSVNGERWGNWQPALYCPMGTYASGFALRVEQPLSGGSPLGRAGRYIDPLSILPKTNPDDTALNNVALFCSDINGQNYGNFSIPQSPNWG
jgi:hypothetical protein